MLDKWKENSLVVPGGGRFIIYTKLIHCGNYVATNEYRTILQFEFSAVEKFGFGQIGAMDYYLNQSAFESLSKFGLLREDH